MILYFTSRGQRYRIRFAHRVENSKRQRRVTLAIMGTFQTIKGDTLWHRVFTAKAYCHGGSTAHPQGDEFNRGEGRKCALAHLLGTGRVKRQFREPVFQFGLGLPEHGVPLWPYELILPELNCHERREIWGQYWVKFHDLGRSGKYTSIARTPCIRDAVRAYALSQNVLAPWEGDLDEVDRQLASIQSRQNPDAGGSAKDPEASGPDQPLS